MATGEGDGGRARPAPRELSTVAEGAVPGLLALPGKALVREAAGVQRGTADRHTPLADWTAQIHWPVTYHHVSQATGEVGGRGEVDAGFPSSEVEERIHIQ